MNCFVLEICILTLYSQEDHQGQMTVLPPVQGLRQRKKLRQASWVVCDLIQLLPAYGRYAEHLALL